MLGITSFETLEKFILYVKKISIKNAHVVHLITILDHVLSERDDLANLASKVSHILWGEHLICGEQRRAFDRSSCFDNFRIECLVLSQKLPQIVFKYVNFCDGILILFIFSEVRIFLHNFFNCRNQLVQ